MDTWSNFVEPLTVLLLAAVTAVGAFVVKMHYTISKSEHNREIIEEIGDRLDDHLAASTSVHSSQARLDAEIKHLHIRWEEANKRMANLERRIELKLDRIDDRLNHLHSVMSKMLDR